MKTLAEFKASLKSEQPDSGLCVQLKSLWFDGKGNWHKAHAQVDDQTDRESAWVHAYLHRKEGDIWNADYWYSRARQTRPNMSLDDEWEQLVKYFLDRAKA
ncbi:hypothetical protein ACFQZS_10570 [Mucilaginibacter calamicampi]|uniref:Uncharacterized protein n=1 Tax=Mucilaginibacter calamicampi TaxID=1302352 RepID=A0ABW2YWL7_9SPHI